MRSVPTINSAYARIPESPRADAAVREALRLVQRLWDELRNLYQELSALPFLPNEIAGERTDFVIARLAAEPIGSGARRPFSEAEPGGVEVRRCFEKRL